MQDIEIRLSRSEDAIEMAALHIAEIPGGPFEMLGIKFAVSVYEMFIRECVSVTCAQTGQLAGFVCGGGDTGAVLKKYMKDNFFRLAILGLKALSGKGVLKTVLKA